MNRPRWACEVLGLLVLLPSVLCGASQNPRKPSVEVQVEVTEVDNQQASDFGVDWLDKISISEQSPSGVVSLGAFQRLSPVHADVRFLIEEGAAELLANPNLVTDSGTTASFHAGGEIPYITSSSLGTTHVEFKQYGVALEARPRVVGGGLIQLQLRASISAPDRANGAVLSGNTVPALLERAVSSNVTVNSGSAITLAGLVQTQKEEKVRRVPILGRVPLLGGLFRWRSRQNQKTTIIIFVTPRVVDL